MSPIAILSDIHGNLEALEAVLADIAGQQITDIVCLGDVVGYGPNPLECIDRMMSCRCCLMGDCEEEALLSTGESGALEVRNEPQLDVSEDTSRGHAARRLSFLQSLPREQRDGEFLYVHGSPRDPVREYVFPEDIYNQRKMERLFELVPQYAFHGHTHLPGVLTQSLHFRRPDEMDFEYALGSEKAMINIGSVGQPRDGDWRASYAILEVRSVRFRRVEYGIETTIRKSG